MADLVKITPNEPITITVSSNLNFIKLVITAVDKEFEIIHNGKTFKEIAKKLIAEIATIRRARDVDFFGSEDEPPLPFP